MGQGKEIRNKEVGQICMKERNTDWNTFSGCHQRELASSLSSDEDVIQEDQEEDGYMASCLSMKGANKLKPCRQ
jgi:hypothetical protein